MTLYHIPQNIVMWLVSVHTTNCIPFRFIPCF